MGKVHLPTVAAISFVVFASAVVLHEGGHAVAGWLVGGKPTLLSTTDLRGEWKGVSAFGFTALGMSGSLVNWLLAGLALLLARRGASDPATRWFLWLMLAVNGFIPAVYMVASPLMGFGDWMTILQRWPGTLVWRVVVGAVGLGVSWCWWKLVAARLTALVGVAEGRADFCRRLVLTSWLSGAALAAAAALRSPLGLQWALFIAIGSTLGTTWPMMPAARAAAARPPGPTGLVSLGRHTGWMVTGAVFAAVFVFLFGRGISLG